MERKNHKRKLYSNIEQNFNKSSPNKVKLFTDKCQIFNTTGARTTLKPEKRIGNVIFFYLLRTKNIKNGFSQPKNILKFNFQRNLIGKPTK